MRFQRLLIASSLLLPLSFGCNSSVTNSSSASIDCNCSLIQLIANPSYYNKKRVRVIGFVMAADKQPGVGHLYLSADDARYLNDSNSVWLELAEESEASTESIHAMHGNFVVVEGVFRNQNDVLVIEDISRTRVLAPLSLDETRFGPGVSGIDSEIVPNPDTF